MEDRDIIDLIKAEDERGLDELLKRYGPFIKYIISGVLSKYPQDMEECLNDIRYKLWTGIRTYDESKSTLKTYISYIARNCAIDSIRKINRHELNIDKNVDWLYEKLNNTTSKSAEDEVFKSEHKDYVQKKLVEEIRKLRKTEMEIFVRKYYYLQSVHQIATEFNCSEKSIEGKLSRIRKKLKKSLKGLY